MSENNLIFAQASLGSCLFYFAPFAILLGLVAILPLLPATASWWAQDRHKAWIAGLCAAAGVALYLGPTGDGAKVLETLLDYLAFMAVLGSLYVVCGGIHIVGGYTGSPGRNTLFLLGGAVLANLMGVMGASMLLIRPLLRANRHRHNNAHTVVFFIFVVSNAGGLLTPLGGAPLYLGYLQGVPFAWTLRLLPQWGLLLAMVLGVFYLVDRTYFARESVKLQRTLSDPRAEGPGIQVHGRRNVILLFALLAVILASGYAIQPALTRLYGPNVGRNGAEAVQIVLLAGIALLSFYLTAPHFYRSRFRILSAYEKNSFSFAALLEVAILFFGIFGAMLPALAVLQAKAPTLGLESPWQYFWGCGLLSGFLDNAPAYLAFATLAASKSGLSIHALGEVAARFPRLLEAVACGAVFMGALSYIGNGPNFMVKAIADHSKVKMPGFFGYMIWSMVVLVPIFVIESLVFFR